MTAGASGAGSLADSMFTWQFEALGGQKWGGWLVADSVSFAVGSVLTTAHGRYTILSEDERSLDLSAFGLEEGQVFVEWFLDGESRQFAPIRNGAAAAAGSAGLGSEVDFAWTASGWAAFGLGGDLLPGDDSGLADTRFVWVFEAWSGDHWSGVLFDLGTQYDVGSAVTTDHGRYRILDEAAIEPDLLVVRGAVALTGNYHDAASRLQLPVLTAGAGGPQAGSFGLGSELGQAWNGSGWIAFGQGGALQVDAPAEGGFAPARLVLGALGAGSQAGGWASNTVFPRALGDVNGDGRADIVGFANAGVLVALADGSGGFAGPRFALGALGAGPEAGGWASNTVFPRALGDVNGDGRADIVGFANAGVLVALADGAGGFAVPRFALGALGAGAEAGGWASNTIFPRMLGDVNGDGRADIVGFANAGVLVALADGAGGFATPQLSVPAFGAAPEAGGWLSNDIFLRMVADVNGDSRTDIVGFAAAGVAVGTALSATDLL